jgi:hypothetical protein
MRGVRALVVQRLGVGRLMPVIVGFAVLGLGTVAGWDGRVVGAIATPPAFVRAALVGIAVVAGLVLLGRAMTRLGASDPVPGGQRDLVSLTRGVRLAFLAVAAFAAAGGWAVGHPLPIVVGLVIAGVDVLETSFLLLVIASRSVVAGDADGDASRPVSDG